jgi:hypothetical protein
MDERRRPDPTCRQCRSFVDDPDAIQKEFPGVTILGSMYASVRGNAGLCRTFDRFMDPISADDCEAFDPLGEAP